MTNRAITGYTGRLNTALNRKEWLRYGHGTLVVGTGQVVTGGLTLSLAASASTVAIGTVVTLTATVTGGTGPYTYVFTAPSTVTLSGTGATRTFTAGTNSVPTFQVTVTDASSPALTQVATQSVTIGTGTTSLYAGHVPNRVMISLAGPENGVPSFDQSLVIVKTASMAQLGVEGVGSYARRRFTGTGASGTSADTQELRDMLADGDADGMFNWVSFKVINTDWAGVAAGNYPNLPQMFRTVAIERRNAGARPFMASLHHEPRGDGVLTDWSAMHVYMSNAVKDVNDIMCWSAIGNGFLWNTVKGTTSNQTDRAATFPQIMIDTFRANRGVLAVDTYDDHPVYTGQTTYPVGSQNSRASVKMANYIDWMRARACGALGFGEWSCTDVGEMAKVPAVLWANRDLLGIANYFNSGANSTWDWRLVVNGYPIQDSSNPIDYGGTLLTQGRLNYWPTIVRDSTAAANTGPL